MKDRVIGGAEIALKVALGAAEAFTPLKAILATVSAVYDQYKVHLLLYAGGPLLTHTYLGNRRCHRQDRSCAVARCCVGGDFREALKR